MIGRGTTDPTVGTMTPRRRHLHAESHSKRRGPATSSKRSEGGVGRWPNRARRLPACVAVLGVAASVIATTQTQIAIPAFADPPPPIPAGDHRCQGTERPYTVLAYTDDNNVYQEIPVCHGDATGGRGGDPGTPPVDTTKRLVAGSMTAVSPGVSSLASAVLTNLTMVDGATAGYVTADRCSALTSDPQTKSSGNHGAAAAIANLAVVPLDADGRFCIYNQSPVNLVVDVQGYFAPPSAGGQLFTSLPTTRRLDTRVAPLTRPSAGSVTRVSTGVAAGTSAVLVNLTMVDGVTPGYITADKCSTLTAGPQAKSSGNYGVSSAIANLSVVPVDADGSFCIYNQTPVNLVVDVQGSFSATAPSGELFTLVAPSRKLDTRVAPLSQPSAGSITRVSTGVAAGTSAVLVNLTMVNGASPGYITAGKCSVMVAGPQAASSGNHGTTTAIANLSVVPVDVDGSFCIYNQASVNLVVDLQGSFSAAGSQQFFPVGPTRVLDTR